MKPKTIQKLNEHYRNHLQKPENRKKLNDFLYFFLWPLAYRVAAVKGIDKKLILFVANAENSMPNDFKLLFDHCESKGYRCICLYKFKDNDECFYKNELSKIKSDLVFQSYYARAKVTFLNEYYLPAYANKPRKGSRLVQLWHGCGAFKRFSYSVRDVNWGLESDLFDRYNVHRTYTDIVASGEYFIPKWEEAFNASPGVIKPLGTPRTDVFFDKEFIKEQRGVIDERFPAAKGKKIILWAPTLRGADVKSAYTDKALDFMRLKREFGDEYVLMIKLHPRIRGWMKFTPEEKEELKGFLIDISKGFSINTALCAADICVTDYSSLIFEYSLLDRPMIFFAYDLDEYKDGRNFYYDYESFVPGRIVKTNDELIEAIKVAEASPVDHSDFRKKFMSACDGHSTERVFDTIVKNGENH